MNCPRCNAYNPSDARFCSQCGTALAASDEEARGSQEPKPGQSEGPVGYEAPTPVEQPLAMEAVVYAGFWIRGAALVIDTIIATILQFAITALEPTGILAIIVGVSYPVLFIGLRGQTPGKMALGIKVVKPGRQAPGMGTAILREILGKFLSGIALGLGYAWAGWDPCKQGWHDKIAGTYVIRTQGGLFQPPR